MHVGVSKTPACSLFIDALSVALTTILVADDTDALLAFSLRNSEINGAAFANNFTDTSYIVCPVCLFPAVMPPMIN